MKPGWTAEPLSANCSIDYGTRVVRKNDAGTRYPVYGGGGATFSIDQTNRADCLIVSRFGMSEHCARFVIGEFFLNDSGLTVSTEDDEVLHQRFLDYQLIYRQPEIYGLSRGSAQRNLNVDAFRQLPITRADDVAEQRRIVEVLDEAFAALATATANTEQALTNARELLASTAMALIQAQQGQSCEKSLGNFCNLYQPKTISKAMMTEDGEYVVFGANGPIGRYHEYNHEEPQLLVTCRGATCGTVNVSEPLAWITGNAMVVKPKPNSLRVGLLRQILEHAFDFSDVITGSAQPQITRQSLAPAVLKFPEDEREQVRLEEQINQLEEQTSQLSHGYTTKLTLLAELRQSLLARAFAGELT